MSQKFVLKCSDGTEFEIEEAVALQSQTIKLMIEDECAADNIPVPIVTAPILAKVIEYLKRHVAPNTDDADLKAFDDQFVNVDRPILFKYLMAAKYLDIKKLLDLTCKAVADMIKDFTPEEIRRIFNIENDFTPEEEEKPRKENAWAYVD